MTAIAGHRGFGTSRYTTLPENSVPSVLAAIQAGVEWVEIDARLTRDGYLFAAHNPELADGRILRHLTRADARAAGLTEVADLLEAVAGRVGVNIDVKTGSEDATCAWEESTGGRLESLLERLDTRGEILISSFDPSVPARFARTPGVLTGLLGWPYFPLRKLLPAAVHLGLDAVVVHDQALGANQVDASSYPSLIPFEQEFARARAAGLLVACYCPTVTDLPALVSAGLDIAIVNDIPGALATRDAHTAG